MPGNLSCSEIEILHREAAIAARRVVRTLALPAHEFEDLRQDLLVDLVGRLKYFDPTKGTLGAFANVVIRHRTACLISRISRSRENRIGIDRQSDCESAEGSVVQAPFGWADVDARTIERRLDLIRALHVLRPEDLALCSQLIDRTPTEISETAKRSRASVYRQIRHIRRRLLEAGVSATAA
jgi:DNA-directed RNA polymerase specialized sigma24 family protein